MWQFIIANKSEAKNFGLTSNTTRYGATVFISYSRRDARWLEMVKTYLKPFERDGRIKWHTFRHTFGTILNANGENPKVIQELLCMKRWSQPA